MSRLFLFNPENDLALAHGKAQYTAPPNAQLLHNAGATLPIWYCNEGDSILAHKLNREWLQSQQQLFEVPNIEDSTDNISELLPWGWSLNTCRQFSEYGVDSSLLPNEISIEKIRQLSHRRHTINVISQINEICNINLPQPIEATSTTQVIDFLIRQHFRKRKLFVAQMVLYADKARLCAKKPLIKLKILQCSFIAITMV